MVVEPLGFPQDAFLDESEPFGHTAALQVAGSAMQKNTIAALFGKCVIGNTGHGSCHDAAALAAGVQPVTEFRFLIERVDVVLADHTGELPIAHDSKRQSVFIRSLLDGAADEPGCVADAPAAIQPGKPLAKMRPIPIDERR